MILHTVVEFLNSVCDMKCEDKVPWIGGKPTEICNLDDKDQLEK